MGWGVVEMHVGMLFQPALGGFVLVNVEVVDHHMQLPLGESGDDIVHEPQKVHRRAALFDVCDYFSAGDLQGRQ